MRKSAVTKLEEHRKWVEEYEVERALLRVKMSFHNTLTWLVDEFFSNYLYPDDWEKLSEKDIGDIEKEATKRAEVLLRQRGWLRIIFPGKIDRLAVDYLEYRRDLIENDHNLYQAIQDSLSEKRYRSECEAAGLSS